MDRGDMHNAIAVLLQDYFAKYGMKKSLQAFIQEKDLAVSKDSSSAAETSKLEEFLQIPLQDSLLGSSSNAENGVESNVSVSSLGDSASLIETESVKESIDSIVTDTNNAVTNPIERVDSIPAARKLSEVKSENLKKIPSTLLVPIVTLSENRPDTWTNDEDTGYSREIVTEEEMLYTREDSSDDEVSFSVVTKSNNVDVNMLINQKIANMQEEFPGEMQRLHQMLALTTNEDDATIDNILLKHIELAKQGKLVSEIEEAEEMLKQEEQQKPVEYESFDLKVIQVKNRTGFEETKDYPIVINEVIGGRYMIEEYLGSAAFSRAVQCIDLHHRDKLRVCVKIITNNKDFFDQSMDEIKLLLHINAAGDPDKYHVLRMFDYFYHKEHLFIVSELLRDNLYEFYKYNRESGDELYFTIPRLRKISKQVLEALRFIHSMNIIHCDLKPENILIKSYSRCEVKVIDFGSSCFTTDHLSSYVQSRSYRAPEVILGLPYDAKIDIWSLGCILAELWTGKVLFLNESLQTLLARVNSIMGSFPPHMLQRARHANRYFTPSGKLYERRTDGRCFFLKPKPCSLRHRLKCDDPLFVDFVGRLLQVDPSMRPSAQEALNHPFLMGT